MVTDVPEATSSVETHTDGQDVTMELDSMAAGEALAGLTALAQAEYRHSPVSASVPPRQGLSPYQTAPRSQPLAYAVNHTQPWPTTWPNRETDANGDVIKASGSPPQREYDCPQWGGYQPYAGDHLPTGPRPPYTGDHLPTANRSYDAHVATSPVHYAFPPTRDASPYRALYAPPIPQQARPSIAHFNRPPLMPALEMPAPLQMHIPDLSPTTSTGSLPRSNNAGPRKKKTTTKAALDPNKPVEQMTTAELEVWEAEQQKRQRSAIAHKESSQRFRDRTKEKNKQRDARLQELEMRLPMLEQQLRQAQLGQPPDALVQQLQTENQFLRSSLLQANEDHDVVNGINGTNSASAASGSTSPVSSAQSLGQPSARPSAAVLPSKKTKKVVAKKDATIEDVKSEDTEDLWHPPSSATRSRRR